MLGLTVTDTWPPLSPRCGCVLKTGCVCVCDLNCCVTSARSPGCRWMGGQWSVTAAHWQEIGYATRFMDFVSVQPVQLKRLKVTAVASHWIQWRLHCSVCVCVCMGISLQPHPPPHKTSLSFSLFLSRSLFSSLILSLSYPATLLSFCVLQGAQEVSCFKFMFSSCTGSGSVC